MADESVLDNLPARRVPFWQTATPMAIRALDAANFRRTAEANRFVADNSPSVDGSFGDIVGGQAGTPSTPFRQRRSGG